MKTHRIKELSYLLDSFNEQGLDQNHEWEYQDMSSDLFFEYLADDMTGCEDKEELYDLLNGNDF